MLASCGLVGCALPRKTKNDLAPTQQPSTATPLRTPQERLEKAVNDYLEKNGQMPERVDVYPSGEFYAVPKPNSDA
jgi:hypothetical protein